MPLVSVRCPACGEENGDGALICGLCQTLFVAAGGGRTGGTAAPPYPGPRSAARPAGTLGQLLARLVVAAGALVALAVMAGAVYRFSRSVRSRTVERAEETLPAPIGGAPVPSGQSAARIPARRAAGDQRAPGGGRRHACIPRSGARAHPGNRAPSLGPPTVGVGTLVRASGRSSRGPGGAAPLERPHADLLSGRLVPVLPAHGQRGGLALGRGPRAVRDRQGAHQPGEVPSGSSAG
jgi:hypothetical protein